MARDRRTPFLTAGRGLAWLGLTIALAGCPYVGDGRYTADIRDFDGDGEPAERFGGRDCQDDNPFVVVCDADGDGENSILAGGTDCDDDNADINSAAVEVCNEVDDNCDGLVDDVDPALDTTTTSTWYRDGDGDGFGNLDDTREACAAPLGYLDNAEDCDDSRDDINPDANEFCDIIDHDCDGSLTTNAVDQIVFFIDEDLDGYGRDEASTELGCPTAPPAGTSATNDDCDDADDTVHPNAEDTWYDGIDSDCMGDSDFDQDGDGFDHLADDCDDQDPTVRPGVAERCDLVDNDCDGSIDEVEDVTPFDLNYYYVDVDGDGAGTGPAVLSCSPIVPAGYASSAGDCDDDNDAVNPGGTEVCDGVDNDCNGRVDDNAANRTTFYVDGDGDGFGNVAILGCELVAGWADVDGDCNDGDAGVYPGAYEVCGDAAIQDCDRSAPLFDCDGDGFDGSYPGNGNAGTDCDDASAITYPDAPEICDGKDNDCDTGIDNPPTEPVTVVAYFLDIDGDGFGAGLQQFPATCGEAVGMVANNDDCNDLDPTIHPNAGELCDGVDNNCDGDIDTGAIAEPRAYYLDADGDGAGDPHAAYARSCLPPDDGQVWLDVGTDCDDEDPDIGPHAVEVCDGIDNDCDGQLDDADPDTEGAAWYPDTDEDGYGAGAPISACSQPVGYVDNGDDCNDTRPDIHPYIAEICNGIDDDCDGFTDDADPNVASGVPWYPDGDADGYGDLFGTPREACNQPVNYVSNNLDCDDAAANVNPAAVEGCDGADNDCDGSIDDADADVVGGQLWYQDADQDGVGSGAAVYACAQPVDGDGIPTAVAVSGDCDDADAARYPGNLEVCDGVDNDCDQVDDQAEIVPPYGSIEAWTDGDGDGYGIGDVQQVCLVGARAVIAGGFADTDGDCDDSDPAINPGATSEGCAGGVGLDLDCDGLLGTDDPDYDGISGATYYLDVDGDGFGSPWYTLDSCALTPPPGFTVAGDDCDDIDATFFPGMPWYADSDGDGYGDPAAVTPSAAGTCDPPQGSFVANALDCDDTSGAVYPAAPELCDSIDNDCDSLVDDEDDLLLGRYRYFVDVDGDGFGDTATAVHSCVDSGPPATGGPWVTRGGDCDDGAFGVSPEMPEICGDTVDSDCDGDPDTARSSSSFENGVDYFPDKDGDGFFDLYSLVACAVPSGASPSPGSDCNDDDVTINPDGAEVCGDWQDNDCDSAWDCQDTDCAAEAECGGADSDGDGYAAAEDCDDNDRNNWVSCGSCQDMDGDGFFAGCDAYVDFEQDCNDDFLDCTSDCADVDQDTIPDCADDCIDWDQDGYGLGQGCAGVDCNDNDPNVDLETTWFEDSDEDGFGDDNVTGLFCGDPGAPWVAVGGDCAPQDPNTKPGAVELCDSFDNDCDQVTDEGTASVDWWLDNDGDGRGDNLSTPTSDCAQPSAQHVQNNNDFCDGNTNAWTEAACALCGDGDGDNYFANCDRYQSVPEDCDDTSGLCAENCGTDVDSDSVDDCKDTCIDGDGDGYGVDGNGGTCLGADCNDAADTCASDCTTNVDGDGVVDCLDDCLDADGDGFGVDGPAGVCAGGPDCNDAADTCTSDCTTDADGDSLEDCLDDCLDADGDGRGTPINGGSCLSDGCDDRPEAWLPASCQNCIDSDGDNFWASCDDYTVVGGGAADCDDAEPAAYPGNSEICDGIDNDCANGADDGLTYADYYLDSDGDTYGTGAALSLCADPGPGFSTTNTDCSDSDPNNWVSCGTCKDSDNDGTFVNCDAYTSIVADCDDADKFEFPGQVWYRDCDGDATFFATPDITACDREEALLNTSACGVQPSNVATSVAGAFDCDDANQFRSPTKAEDCSTPALDEDCDGDPNLAGSSGLFAGQTYWSGANGDGDGYVDINDDTAFETCQNTGLQDGDCNDGSSSSYPGAPELCDGLDNDCNGLDDFGNPGTEGMEADGDTDGYPLCVDCDDGNGAINPGEAEVCDGLNNDCDGATDEGFATSSYYQDGDLDGFADDAAVAEEFCYDPGVNYTLFLGDCDDGDAAVNPGATDGDCDGIDNNCDDIIDNQEADSRLDWAADWSNSPDPEYIVDLVVDSTGNTHTLSQATTQTNFNGSTYTFTNPAGIVAMHSATGAPLDLVIFESPELVVEALAYDSFNSRVFVVGHGKGTLLADGSSYPLSSSLRTAWVASVNLQTYALDWVATFPGGTTGESRAMAVAFDTNANEVVMAGSFAGDLDFGGKTGVLSTGGLADQDGLVVVLSASVGTANRAYRFGQTDGDEAVLGIDVNSVGEHLVVGSFVGCASIGTTSLGCDATGGAFFATVDGYSTSAAAELGVGTVSTSNGDEQLHDVVASPDLDGSFYVGGTYENATTIGATSLSVSTVVRTGHMVGRVKSGASGELVVVWAEGTEGGLSATNRRTRLAVDDGVIGDDEEQLLVAVDAFNDASATFAGVEITTGSVGSVFLLEVDGGNGQLTSSNRFGANTNNELGGVGLTSDGNIRLGATWFNQEAVDGLTVPSNTGAPRPVILAVRDTYYTDGDLDGFGAAGGGIFLCGDTSGYARNTADCDDASETVYPFATEACDDVDNDCNGLADEFFTDQGGSSAFWYVDGDGDGVTGSDGYWSCPDGSAPQDAGVGYTFSSTNEGDCDDGNASISPNVPSDDNCDGIDDDCDLNVDENSALVTYYYDGDNDTFGDDASTLDACSDPGAPWVTVGGDCDDTLDSRYPGGPAFCDGLDNDCDGLGDANEDQDTDGVDICADCNDQEALLGGAGASILVGPSGGDRFALDELPELCGVVTVTLEAGHVDNGAVILLADGADVTLEGNEPNGATIEPAVSGFGLDIQGPTTGSALIAIQNLEIAGLPGNGSGGISLSESGGMLDVTIDNTQIFNTEDQALVGIGETLAVTSNGLSVSDCAVTTAPCVDLDVDLLTMTQFSLSNAQAPVPMLVQAASNVVLSNATFLDNQSTENNDADKRGMWIRPRGGVSYTSQVQLSDVTYHGNVGPMYFSFEFLPPANYGFIQSLWAAENPLGVVHYDGAGYLDFYQINSVGNGGDGTIAPASRAPSFRFTDNGSQSPFTMQGATFVDDYQPFDCGVPGSTVQDVIAASIGGGALGSPACAPNLSVSGLSMDTDVTSGLGSPSGVETVTTEFERVFGTRWGASGASVVMPARHVDTHPRYGFDWAWSGTNNSGRNHGAHLLSGYPDWAYQEDTTSNGLPDAIIDVDADNLPDAWEIFWIGDLSSGEFDDPDLDGSNNSVEFSAHTHPGVPDTDGDGEPDNTDGFPLDPTQTGGI